MGTKNNPKNRQAAAQKKTFDGKEIEPILYHGTNAGHGKYIAARYSGGPANLVVDENKRPIQWDEIA